MPFFSDAFGHPHRVRIVYETVCRVRDSCGVDLLNPHGGEPALWRRLAGDDALLVDVLYVATGGHDPVAFARALRGNGWRQWWSGVKPADLEPARVAFFDAWAEFWPEPDDKPAGKSGKVDIEKHIWQFAGMVGVHPGAYTLRQLALMAEGRGRAAWAQTSLLAAPAFNAIRDPKRRKQPFVPDDFNPYAERPKQEPLRISVRDLKGMFTSGEVKRMVTLNGRQM